MLFLAEASYILSLTTVLHAYIVSFTLRTSFCCLATGITSLLVGRALGTRRLGDCLYVNKYRGLPFIILVKYCAESTQHQPHLQLLFTLNTMTYSILIFAYRKPGTTPE